MVTLASVLSGAVTSALLRVLASPVLDGHSLPRTHVPHPDQLRPLNRRIIVSNSGACTVGAAVSRGRRGSRGKTGTQGVVLSRGVACWLLSRKTLPVGRASRGHNSEPEATGRRTASPGGSGRDSGGFREIAKGIAAVPGPACAPSLFSLGVDVMGAGVLRSAGSMLLAVWLGLVILTPAAPRPLSGVAVYRRGATCRAPRAMRARWRSPGPAPLVYLTFDDGPHPVNTPRILEVLAAHGVLSTFFVVGSMVERWPETARRIVEAGHSIQLHSWGHDNLTGFTRQEFMQDTALTQAVLEEVVDRRGTCLRPPYGAVNEKPGGVGRGTRPENGAVERGGRRLARHLGTGGGAEGVGWGESGGGGASPRRRRAPRPHGLGAGDHPPRTQPGRVPGPADVLFPSRDPRPIRTCWEFYAWPGGSPLRRGSPVARNVAPGVGREGQARGADHEALFGERAGQGVLGDRDVVDLIDAEATAPAGEIRQSPGQALGMQTLGAQHLQPAAVQVGGRFPVPQRHVTSRRPGQAHLGESRPRESAAP